jgi:hypothetical protein
MPNYCYNRLRVEGPDGELEKLAAAVADPGRNDPDSRFSYAQIMPLADGGDEGKAWGSPSLYCLEVSQGRGELVYKFESSWDPPSAVVAALAAQWPDLVLEHVYIEPLTGRYAREVYERGSCYQWPFGGGYSNDDADMRAFLEDEWPELAREWWDEEEDG